MYLRRRVLEDLLALRGDAGQGTRIGCAMDDNSHVSLFAMSSSSGDVQASCSSLAARRMASVDLVGVEADGGVAAGLQDGSDDLLARAAVR